MRAEFRAVGKEEIFSRRAGGGDAGATLDRGEQVILLLNRRGYSSVVMCRSCGEKVECENCAISMTFHTTGRQGSDQARGSGVERSRDGRAAGGAAGVPLLRVSAGVPKTKCPKCGSEHLYFLGAGSQQGEEKLLELFPDARIGRMDRDTVRGRGDMERLLARLHGGEINLLVGTQMIAKGHDIHGVTLVGVVGADFALGLPDFRAAERVFQLLTQVSGRAGRGELPGKVLVQTYHPDHYAIQVRGAARLPGVCGEGDAVSAVDALSAVCGAGERGGAEREAGGGGGSGRRRWGGGSRAGRRCWIRCGCWGRRRRRSVRLKRIYRYHFVLKAERRQVLRGGAAGDAGVCGRGGGDAATKPGGGCGCGAR